MWKLRIGVLVTSGVLLLGATSPAWASSETTHAGMCGWAMEDSRRESDMGPIPTSVLPAPMPAAPQPVAVRRRWDDSIETPSLTITSTGPVKTAISAITVSRPRAAEAKASRKRHTRALGPSVTKLPSDMFMPSRCA